MAKDKKRKDRIAQEVLWTYIGTGFAVGFITCVIIGSILCFLIKLGAL